MGSGVQDDDWIGEPASGIYDEDETDDEDEDMESVELPAKSEKRDKIDQEQLIRGFKYGSTYVPCPEGQFPRLSTRKGIDICGFFPDKNVCFTTFLINKP